MAADVFAKFWIPGHHFGVFQARATPGADAIKSEFLVKNKHRIFVCKGLIWYIFRYFQQSRFRFVGNISFMSVSFHQWETGKTVCVVAKTACHRPYPDMPYFSGLVVAGSDSFFSVFFGLCDFAGGEDAPDFFA